MFTSKSSYYTIQLAKSLSISDMILKILFISLSLLCLNLGISFDDKGKIFVAFNKIIRN